MTEALGDAVLDLTVDATELITELNAARDYTRRQLTAMAADTAVLDTAYAKLGSTLTRSTQTWHSTALVTQLAAMTHGVADLTRALDTLTLSSGRASTGFRDLAESALVMGHEVAGVYDTITRHAVDSTATIVATSRIQAAAINDVTHAYILQAAAAHGIGDAGMLRALAPGGLTPAAMTALGQGTSQRGGVLVYGSRGANQAGSINNPVVVTLEAGQYAAMGDRAAAVGAATASMAQAAPGGQQRSIYGYLPSGEH